MSDDFAYPIGKFVWEGPTGAADRARRIDAIAAAPAALRAAVSGLSEAQLDTSYRPGGWTVRQVVHHVPDSHMNAYVRFRRAVTEDAPAVPGYDEKAWAELGDVKAVPVETSLALLDALHVRWAAFLRSLKGSDFERAYVHGEMGHVPLDRALGLYAWHGRHHAAQVAALRARMGW
jgi:hypothetical protein